MSWPTGGPDQEGSPPPAPRRPVLARQPLSPGQVRAAEFTRTALGRRGYNEDEVRLFLTRVAEDLAAAMAEKAALRAEVDRLRNYYREHRPEPGGQVPSTGRAGGSRGPDLAAINLISQAQQTADAQVAQAEQYSRTLVTQARDHYEEIMREATTRASLAAGDSGGGDATSTWEPGSGIERDALERRIAWLRTFAEVTQVQLRSVFEALTREVDKLGDLAAAAPPAPAPEPPVGVTEGPTDA